MLRTNNCTLNYAKFSVPIALTQLTGTLNPMESLRIIQLFLRLWFNRHTPGITSITESTENSIYTSLVIYLIAARDRVVCSASSILAVIAFFYSWRCSRFHCRCWIDETAGTNCFVHLPLLMFDITVNTYG